MTCPGPVCGEEVLIYRCSGCTPCSRIVTSDRPAFSFLERRGSISVDGSTVTGELIVVFTAGPIPNQRIIETLFFSACPKREKGCFRTNKLKIKKGANVNALLPLIYFLSLSLLIKGLLSRSSIFPGSKISSWFNMCGGNFSSVMCTGVIFDVELSLRKTFPVSSFPNV